MTIRYQGEETRTDAATVAAFLAEKGVGANAVVEYAGEVYGPGADLAALSLEENGVLNVYGIVSGG
ncbi:MAG: hypothetical protein ILO34_05350 [Kiritimatiellae bacterium]|nr:hypothetical protein [Kiritimatiellia bacterium]